MINRDISIHLQDFPDISFLPSDHKLIEEMDLVRNICSSVLSIRDHKNLRVRLPLSSLTIIGKNSEKFTKYFEIIAEEVNVKKISLATDISQYGEYKLQLNFKKIGAKFGAKIKAMTQAVKENKWELLTNNKISICDETLENDDFEIKLSTKNIDESKFAIIGLPSNDYLVMLNIEITEELESEGIARDIIRAIQQNRKDAMLDITDRINVKLFSSQSKILENAKKNAQFIKSQTLIDNLEICHEKTSENNGKIFESTLDDGDLQIAIF